MSKDLEGLLRSAARVKRSSEEDPQSALNVSDLEPVITDPDSFEVFTKLTGFARIGLLAFGVIFPVTIGMLFYFFLRTWLITALFVWYGLVAVAILVNVLRYRIGYLGWEKRLPFKLIGWRECLSVKRVYCDLCWTNLMIEVEMSNVKRADALKYVRAALDLFCARTQRSFYTREIGATGPDRRRKWTVKTETSAEGSANPDVLREMKRLFQRELAMVAVRTGGISRVTVTATSKEFQEPIEIPTSEGTAS